MVRKLLIGVVILLFTTNCHKDESPIYYDAVGEGYVYFKTTRTPVPFVSVAVSNYPAKSSGLGSTPELEIYTADENGFYSVRFIKRYNWAGNIYRGSSVHVDAPGPPWNNYDEVYFDKDFLQKQNKTFKIDTLWLENY